MKYILTSREMDLKYKNDQISCFKYCEKQVVINTIFGHLSFKLQITESAKGDWEQTDSCIKMQLWGKSWESLQVTKDQSEILEMAQEER